LKKAFLIIILTCIALSLGLTPVHAETKNEKSIIVATGKDVPLDDHLPEEYRFPDKYRENAIQFVTEDGVELCGYVLGNGSRGITLGHANGWMVKSWLPFAERLVDAGYQVILWEFRNNEPSGSAEGEAANRWDLDVLAAARVLRERGATQILSMGASDGGTATAAAAPYIPDLVGLGILSSPSINAIKGGKGKALEGVGEINVPSFFAVSDDDFAGDFYPHVKALYEASSSTQKQFNVIHGSDHGTDMITPEVPGVGYSKFPENEENKQKRFELADKLMLFVDGAFSKNKDEADRAETETHVSTTENDKGKTDTSRYSPEGDEPNDRTENSSGKTAIYPLMIGGGVLALLMVVVFVTFFRTRNKN
jgi:dienelactone hydrolase